MKGYLIDMDGVVYRGKEIIPGAREFINSLVYSKIPFTFFTNNSQRTRRDTAYKMNRLGFDITEKQIFTCAMATARYLKRQNPNGSAYVIGEGGLLHALHCNGYAVVDNDPDYVIVGEGRTVNMESIEAALNMILRGARLISTNPDPNCPTAHGMRPGCGAIVAMLETATGTKAFSLGKPSPIMMREACAEIGVTPDEVTVIGDTMETDILGGVYMGCHTILVLSGNTRREDLARYAYSPSEVISSIAEVAPPEVIPPEIELAG